MDISKAIEVIRDRDGNPHPDDWELAEAASVATYEIETLKARIAELEAMGPLIEEYGKQLMFFGMHGDTRYSHLANEVLSLAKTILKGGD